MAARGKNPGPRSAAPRQGRPSAAKPRARPATIMPPLPPAGMAMAGKPGAVSADAAALVTIDEANGGQRLDHFLAAKLKGVPKSHFYRIRRSGAARVNKGPPRVANRMG